MRLLLPSLLAASAVALPSLDPASQPQAQHQFERRYTDAQIHNTSTTTNCSAVHIIIDRATGEPASQGVIGTLATMIAAGIKGVTVEWIDYPAILIPYDNSSTTGIYMTKASIQSYADKCSKAKIVLLGYSQGAQVVGDVMCGGGGAIGLGPFTDPLEDKYVKRIAAVVQMGDPRFMPGNSWDAGTAITGGLFPRPANLSCAPVGDLIRSYCDVNDPFCAVPGIDYDVHSTYDIRYNDDAFNFVQGKLNGSSTGKKSDSTKQSPHSTVSLVLVTLLVLAILN